MQWIGQWCCMQRAMPPRDNVSRKNDGGDDRATVGSVSAARTAVLSVVSTMLVLLPWAGTMALPIVPGQSVQHYATVTDPVRIAFDPTGDLYVGRDNSGSGGTNFDAVRVHRVGAGGGPVMEYGASPITDPDAVFFDTTGIFGHAGAVLVGGEFDSARGHITSIHTDGSINPLFGPTLDFQNPSDFALDSTSRLLFANFDDNPASTTQGVYVTTSAADSPTRLIDTGADRAAAIAVDATDRIFVSTTDGRIRLYAPDGSVIDENFVTGLGVGGFSASLAVGFLEGIGEGLFTINASGDLLYSPFSGPLSVVGSGFAPQGDLGFGPDGALYVSEFVNDRILRIVAAVPEPGPLTLLFGGVFAAALFSRRTLSADGVKSVSQH